MKQILLFVSTAFCLCLNFSPAAAPASARLAAPPAQVEAPPATPRVNLQHVPADYGIGEDWCNG